VLFSVIIPTFNRASLLPRTLNSVWLQKLTDREIIVVDDGSTDGTPEYLQSLGDRIQFVRHVNRGPGAARNAGAARARGDYLAFLDSDDVWFPWTLATFLTLIQQHRTPAILSASVLEFHDEAELANVTTAPSNGDVFADYLAASQTGYYVGSGMAVLRRDEFLKSGGFVMRQINCEDHDLALRLGTVSGFVQVIEPPTLGWRRHSASATKNYRRSYEGSRYLVEQEERHAYPGGCARACERREIITRHVRPVAFECLRQGMKREAWELYRLTFRWHVVLKRWRFLLAFPALTAGSHLHGTKSAKGLEPPTKSAGLSERKFRANIEP
jgi:glycosyltransferase involved in cell wall biosynthesis